MSEGQRAVPARAGVLSSLLREDGSVLCPPELADWLIGALVRDLLAAKVAGRGGRPSLPVVAFLDALQASSIAHDERSSAVGTDESEHATIGIEDVLSVAQCAEILECSPRAVRKACIEGRLTGRKTGSTWLITRQNLDTYRYAKRGSHDQHKD
jgi:excisionase family DNA binding protein